jgi:hypothetical protein
VKWQPLAWTDLAGDLRTVTLDPVVEADLNIWITHEADRAVAEEQAQKAHYLFLDNRVGVRLKWKVQNVADLPGAPSNAVAIINAGVSNDNFLDCQNLAAIRAQPFYVANTLNVYYVRRAFSGRNCAISKVPGMCITSAMAPDFVKADGNINFIGSEATPTTLAHELGHAYGLRPAFCANGHRGDAANIMFPSSTTSTVPRTTLTLGQVFRMNTHGDDWGGTMLIQNNLPARTPRSCFHFSDRGCPRIDLPWPP